MNIRPFGLSAAQGCRVGFASLGLGHRLLGWAPLRIFGKKHVGSRLRGPQSPRNLLIER